MTTNLPPYQRHSETSLKAAIEALEIAETLRGEVYRYFVWAGDTGSTDEEMIQHFGGPARASSIRPRRIELVRQRLVKDSGITRETSSGRDAVVWVVRKDDDA